jgi:hypothetical protein
MADIRKGPAIDDAPEGVENFVKPVAAGGLVANLSPERRVQVEKSLKRKLDARCSLFVLIYIMNYLDRNNIAAARLGGLQEDLGINDTQYATCLSILYVGYICTSPVFLLRSQRAQNPSHQYLHQHHHQIPSSDN